MAEKCYFHGSSVSGIMSLKACSRLHQGTEMVAYLTDNAPYALCYIWDGAHNGTEQKHVTAWINAGLAYYEEQFPDQLRAFYQGVSGYLYSVSAPDIVPVRERECLYYAPHDVPVREAAFIPDVYERLLEYEAAGQFKVRRYCEQTKERQQELTDLIAAVIAGARFYQTDEVQAAFMQKYFAQAWQKAKTR